MAVISESKNVGLAATNYANLVPAPGTAGSIMSTGTSWVEFSTPNACGMKLLLANKSDTGEFATLRMRARSDALSPTVCGNFSASAGANDHGNLIAVQGYAQPGAYTQASSDHISCGLYSCVQGTAATSGRRWSLWTDEHSLTKAAGGHYLHRLSYHPQGTGAGLDGIWTIWGSQVDYLMNIECPCSFMSAGSIAMLVKTLDGDKYIRLYDDAI